MGLGKLFATHLGDFGQGHSATQAGRNLPHPNDKMKTAHPIATKL